jgi:tyrosine-specific transport protein
MKFFSKELVFFEAVAILVGTTIGAGIFGLPYVFSKAGYLTGMLVMIVIGLAMFFSNLFLGEIILSTKQNHQLTGYAGNYFGKKGKYLMFGLILFGLYGNFVSYLIAIGQVAGALFGGPPFFYSILFFCLYSLLIYIGLKIIKKFELVMTMFIFTIILVISFIGYRLIHFSNLGVINWSNFFIPYGAIFFALGSGSALPPLRHLLVGQEKLVKKAIIWGMVIPFVVYILFITVVVGVNGANTTEIASIGLGRAFGTIMILFANIFALFTISTSFIALGQALKETYTLDLKFSHFYSWFFTVSIPLVLFLYGLNDFVQVISLVGAIGGSLQGFLILAMYLKLRSLKKRERDPEYSLPYYWVPAVFTALVYLGGLWYCVFYL